MRVNLGRMEVVVTSTALEEFTQVPRPIQARVLQLVGRLEHWPNVSGAKPLSGKLAGHFRLRTGDYRVQFRLEQTRLIVERIGHRDGFYDD
jgi:mRNA-degrading endonuclease RelE of RelBE toxin-antitoxin system